MQLRSFDLNGTTVGLFTCKDMCVPPFQLASPSGLLFTSCPPPPVCIMTPNLLFLLLGYAYFRMFLTMRSKNIPSQTLFPPFALLFKLFPPPLPFCSSCIRVRLHLSLMNWCKALLKLTMLPSSAATGAFPFVLPFQRLHEWYPL